MKIAIVAPSPVPFCVGGAEKFWWGLLKHINQLTPHQADLIKLPSPDLDFWDLIESYRNFSKLDLTHFDLVISSKYPGWMVHHPNHLCYMLHRLRGLYDTYHLTGCSDSLPCQHPNIVAVYSFMERYSGVRDSLDEFFELLEGLRNCQGLNRDILRFPGPFIKRVVRFLDDIGLSNRAIKKFAAISRNLTLRPHYFPEGREIQVIYPPSSLEFFRHGEGKYLFTISRLDNAKRVDLLIQAMKFVDRQVELKIAGTGPDQEYLKDLAVDDERISFLGFVKDRDVIDLYADSFAVVYVPYDEDYGLVTIEAMMSGKTVITTTDAGGPNEFVKNGFTGYSVPPIPQDIARQINYLYDHAEKTRRMGLNAKEQVREITWDNTLSKLLDFKEKPSSFSLAKGIRKKIVIPCTFPVYPPRGGGQCRIFYLYRYIAQYFDVDLVTIANADEARLNQEIAPGMREIRIPKSTEHTLFEAELSAQVNWVPITDVAMPKLYPLTPDFLEALKKSAATADVVIASHPYLIDAIEQVANGSIWFEAHNVETELKKSIIPDSPVGYELLELTRQVEEKCCEISRLIMVCSDEDSQKLQTLYNANPEKIVIVPNGVEVSKISAISLQQRLAIKRKLGIDGVFSALFVASWHGPNLVAVESIFQIAERLPDVQFLIVGSVSMAFQNNAKPPNVGFMGVVDDETKNTVLSIADIAINPMSTGSGTNLKMLEYCAAGIPVISTPHGVRGIRLEDKVHLTIANIEGFPEAILEYKQMKEGQELQQRITRAREFVTTVYNWSTISQNLMREVDRLKLL